jgi:plastocyanin
MTARPLLSGAAIVVAAAALSACGGGAEAATTAKVDIRAFDFQPDPLTIRKGTTVRFVNHDQIHHTATAGRRSEPKPGVFNVRLGAAKDSDTPSTGRFTFSKAGTYRYFCKFHPGGGMTAKVVVK